MRGFLLRLLVSIAALWLTVLASQNLGIASIRMGYDSFWGLFWTVILLGIVNAVIAPILKLITLPLNCMTLGLVGLLINVFMFWLAASLVPGFHIHGFWAAVFGSLVMGLLNGILQTVVSTQG